MPAAGTLSLTQNSTTVTGSGTAFTSSLAAGGFIVASVGGTSYTLGIKSIDSNTSLTLSVAYTGPTTSGVAYDYVPLATLNLITSALAQQVSQAIRANNLDRDNWQQIFSNNGNVTVRLPDGTNWTGPSWQYVSNQYNNTLKTADIGSKVASQNDTRLGTVDGKTGGVITGGVNIEGNNLNIRSINPSGGWPSFITFMAGQGNNVPFARVYQESSGGVTIAVDVSGTTKYNTFTAAGDFNCPGKITCFSLTQTSDRNKKSNIKKIENGLDKLSKINGYTFTLNETKTDSAGIIAQELKEILPDVVKTFVKKTPILDEDKFPTGEYTEESSLSVDYNGVSAVLIEAVKDLKGIVDKQIVKIEELEKRVKALDGLDA